MKFIIAILLLFALCGFGFYLYPDYARTHTAIVRLNRIAETDEIPANFRVTSMNSSGSSQFSEAGLQKMLKIIGKPKTYIVDLRAESHGFLNGEPISLYRLKNWLNKGKSCEEILAEEKRWLEQLSRNFFLVLYKKKGAEPFFYWVREVASAEEIAHRNGAEYIRFPIDDACPPKDAIVEAFVSFVLNLDKEAWLHFHCSGGKGRSTLFLAMYDMMRNARVDSFETIIARQNAIGGIHLVNKMSSHTWKHEENARRTALIRNFYTYCRENPDFSLSWTEWLKQKQES